ncbi:Uncharacterized conserved protein [Janthinobacterium sp. Marseille]|nr:hypothetical protein [Janthinobacterium sp. Marseille]ABR91626.1 Uncharacterized conserved protein [Janthinobacterium sp. Marseille]
MAYEELYTTYEKQGLRFSRSIITSYCLSLFTKPFVILSGISGTGKTKIAQLFTSPATLALIKTDEIAIPDHRDLPGQWILMTVGDGILGGDGRANLRYSDLSAILNPGEIAALQPEIDRLKRLGQDDNIGEPFTFTIVGENDEELMVQGYLQRAHNPLLRLRFKSKRGAVPKYDSTTYFKNKYKVKDVLKLEKIGEKKLKIVEVNGAAITQKAKQIAVSDSQHVNNTCFISVRSDWADSSAMLGYYNLIDQKYHLTPLVNFMLTAQENPDTPFFLILDEMNLAKVEHYFSDFLSCLESRYEKDGVHFQEKIRLHSGASSLDTNNDYFDVIATEIEIPKNLFVTGTVNVDESTYMFSAKVLDRANVIEFNEVDLDNYDQELRPDVSTKFVLDKFPPLTSYQLPHRSDYALLPPEAKDFIKQIHHVLAKYHLHFGYRVINEISRYILNAQEYCSQDPEILTLALDLQLLQKVLPKLSGAQSKLDLPIRELLFYLTSHSGSFETFDFDQIKLIKVSDAKYPQSVKKLQRMYFNLSLNGFTNFIE